MKLHELEIPLGSRQARKRLGRGAGSGLGTTAGRGGKGQTARAGAKIRRGFEGGQMPLYRRIPKRGFTNIHRKEYAVVNVGDLSEHFATGSTITAKELFEKKLVRKSLCGIKILGGGELKIALHIKAHLFSQSAIQKITTAGGTVEELK